MQIGKMATFTPNSIIILIFDLFHVGLYADFEAFLEFFSKKLGLGSSIYWLTFLVSKNIFPLFSFKVKIIALRSKAKNPDLTKEY